MAENSFQLSPIQNSIQLFSILDLRTINMKVKNLRASLVAQW